MRYPIVRSGIGWMTIPEMLERSAYLYHDNVAMMIKRGGVWDKVTYGELLDKVKRLAKYLKEEIGLKKSDKAAVIGENRPEWGISYLAYQWIGVTVVPVDARLKKPEIKHILKDSESRIIIASSRFLEDLIEIKDELKSLERLISMDENDFNIVNLNQILEKYREGIPKEKVLLDDLAVILYTSGTTGSSKGVMLSHKNLMSNVDALHQCIIFGPGDVFYSILPIHHVFEGTAGFLTPLSGGATVAYARSLKSKIMRDEMQEVKPSVMLVVPLLLEKIVQGIQREISKANPIVKGIFGLMKGSSRALDTVLKGKASRTMFKRIRDELGMGNLRYLVSGGAALPQWVSKALEEMGFPILQGYGLSEASPVCTLNPPSRPKNASIGLPIPYVDVKIVNPNEEGVGELAFRGPNIMVGYYRNEEATKEVLTEDGWLLTGDLGYIDDEGYIYITGRKKAVIVTPGGKNVYPEEVETALLRSPYIEEVLVLRGYNPETGAEEVQAIVYPNFEAIDEFFTSKGIKNPREEDVYALIDKEIEKWSEDLAEYKRVKRFSIREEEFPKTTTRKIKRYLFQKPSFEVKE